MDTAHRYVLHGVSIASELALADLQLCAVPSPAQVRIRVCEVPQPPPQAIVQPSARMHWDGNRLLLSVNGTAKFAITEHEIHLAPEPTSDPEAVRALLLGTAWAACCHLRGRLLLHASAAVIGTTCVAFLGNSGAGKSTLAALLALRGHRLAADDTCVLVATAGTTLLYPGSGHLKLWRDSLPLLAAQAVQIRPVVHQSGKFKLSLAAHWLDQPLPVQRLLLLDSDANGSPPSFVRLARLEALRALAAHTFRPKFLALLGREQHNFMQCAAVSADTEVYRWIRPWGLERAAEMTQMLEDWLSASMQPLLAPPHYDSGMTSVAS